MPIARRRGPRELSSDQPAFESALAALLAGEYERSSGGAFFDFESEERRYVIESRASLYGTRDLDAALMRLARVLQTKPEVSRAILVALVPRMSVARLEKEWHHAIHVLRADVGRRLGLVALAADRDLMVPEDDPELNRLLAIARQAALRNRADDRGGDAHSHSPWSAKGFAIWEALLDAWLRCEGPLSMQELSKRSGASHPTVTGTLRRLHERGELRRSSNRGAEFASTPRRSLSEMVVLADSFRQSLRFIDSSGRRAEPTDLLRRIRKLSPGGITIGGVEAARHYVPTFDLNGLPRVDVSVDGSQSLQWVREVDPALRQARPEEPSSALVVHRGRSASRLEMAPGSGLPFAGPAETLLDLYDLRLTSQADEFVQSMRRSEVGGNS